MKERMIAILGMSMGLDMGLRSDLDPFGPVQPKKLDLTPDPMIEAGGGDTRVRPSNDGWVPFAELQFMHSKWTHFSIDTRDFYGKCHTGEHQYTRPGLPGTPIERWPRKAVKNPERYLYYEDELKVLLNRLYIESGGEGSWRMLTLQNIFRTLNWELKYMRIYRTDNDGGTFLVCNNENFVFSKYDLSQPVNQQYLVFSK